MRSYGAGDLRHRATIEVATKTPDDRGGNAVAWTTFATRWMGLFPFEGVELFRAQQIDPQVTHKIVLRYLAGVLPSMRVRLGSRVFDVRAVMDPEERHEWLELTCTEYKP